LLFQTVTDNLKLEVQEEQMEKVANTIPIPLPLEEIETKDRRRLISTSDVVGLCKQSNKYYVVIWAVAYQPFSGPNALGQELDSRGVVQGQPVRIFVELVSSAKHFFDLSSHKKQERDADDTS